MLKPNDNNGLIIILGAFIVLAVVLFWRPSGVAGGRTVSVAAFDEKLTEDDLVLVKFGATWCGPCRAVEKELDSLDAEKLGVKIVKIDTDQRKELSQQYGITSIPHMMLVRHGKTLDEKLGFMNAGELTSWIKSQQ